MIDFLFATLMLNLHTLKSFHSQMAKSTGLSQAKHNFDIVQSAVSVPVVNCVRACLVTKLCPTFCDTVDRSPPGFSVRGISQARILERVAFFFSRGPSGPSDQTQVS